MAFDFGYTVNLSLGRQFTYLSDKAIEFCGYDAETLYSSGLELIVHPDDQHLLVVYNEALCALPGQHEQVYRIVKSTGEVRQVKEKAVVELTDEGLFLYAVCHDITEVLAQQNEKMVRRTYDHFMHRGADGMLVYKEDGQIATANEYMLKLLGYRRSELYTLAVDAVFIVDDPAEYPLGTKSLPDGQMIRRERRLRHKQGHTIKAEVATRRLGDGRMQAFVRSLTARSSAEAGLLESEMRFRGIVEHTHDLTLLLEQGMIKYASPSALRLMGYTAEEMVHQPLNRFIDSRDAEQIQALLKQITRKPGHQLYGNEVRMHNNHGEMVLVKAMLTNLMDVPGVEGVVMQCTDVTAGEAAREWRFTNDERYRNLVNLSKDAIFRVNSIGTVTFASQACLAIFGYGPDDFMNDSNLLYDRLHPDDRPKFYHFYNEYDRTGVFPEDVTEMRWRHRNGSWIITENVYSNIRNQRGRVAGYQLIARDITDRREMEAALTKAEAQYRMMVESVDAIFYRADAEELQFTFISTHAEKMLGYPHTRWLSEGPDFWLSRLHPDDQEWVPEFISKRIPQGHEFELQYRMIHAAGTVVWCKQMVRVVQVNNRPVELLGLIIDITSQKETEKALRLMSDDLLRSNEDLKQFAYITSHNLRAPVVNLLSLANLLELDTMDENNHFMVSKMVQSAKRLNNTLDDLTAVVAAKKADKKQLQLLMIEEVVEAVLQSIEGQVVDSGAEVTIETSQAPEITYPHGHLESICLNLITNAIKYQRRGVPPVIQVYTEPVEAGVLLVVKDNGRGMDLNKHGAKLFTLYQRFHPGTEGKGIGLYIVKSQVEAMGGHIEVESAPNEGMCFKIYLKDQIAST